MEWANADKRDNHEKGAIGSLNDKTRSAKKRTRNISYRMRASVLLRDGATCRLCGATPHDGAKLHVDHIVPWSKGEETTTDNLQILCEKCNIGKSDIDPTDLSLI